MDKSQLKTFNEHSPQLFSIAYRMLGSAMDAKKLLLLANGEGKADAIVATCEGPITVKWPATIVQMHHHATVIGDKAAASN